MAFGPLVFPPLLLSAHSLLPRTVLHFLLSAPAVFSPPQSQSPPPIVLHDWTTRYPPHACPSFPFDDLRTVLFCSSPCHALPVSVLPSPPESSLTVSSHPITEYHIVAHPIVTRVLASLSMEPRASPSSISALTAAVTDFSATRRLDYATRVVAAPPTHPLSAGGEFALGCDVLDDRQFELEFLAAASPSLCAMLLSPEADPDAFDILTPCTYREAVSGSAPREWHDTLRTTLADLGFHPSSADPSLFDHRGSTPFFVLVYVDDLVFTTTDRVALAEVKSELQKRHTCTDQGELRRYLGFPLLLLSTTDSPPFVAIGRHRPVHWTAAVRVAKYLATTSGVGLVLGGTQPVVLTGHCDSSYRDDVETQRTKAEIYAGAMAA
ncbi:unnamed protein product [Closterium sp. NIES-53]